tara:strand:- start:318 stop:509 length:192 start_codon:yes stop_codon:yes gene_type:complete
MDLDFEFFSHALKEAERLKQKTLYNFNSHSYMIIKTNKTYRVQLFSYPARNDALKSGNLLIII